MPVDDNMIAALKRERAVYESRGETDRVRQVDEQLRHYQGGEDAAPADEEPDGRSGVEETQRTADSAAKKTAAKKATATPKPADEKATPPPQK